MEEKQFEVVILGILFDPINKKILIGRRENDTKIPELSWCFPGGRAKHGEDVDITLKKNMEAKTGYKVKNLGAVFAKTYEEQKNLMGIYFLTEVFEGEEKPGDDIVELKWVSPNELENYFTTSFHKKLKEYLNDLV